MKIVVRKHYRKKRNGVSVVRRHFRASLKKTVDSFRKKHGIKSPVDVTTIKNSKGTSMAHTDSVLDSKTRKPEKHIIRLETNKIKAEGESPKKILTHELAHVLDKERKDKPSKEFHKAAKHTEAYKFLKANGNKYEAAPEEVFARVFAQNSHGTNKRDVAEGLELSRSDFKKVSKKLKKAIAKK